ncbi:hypothetical protein BJY59DRAFT_702310 [Rhodotorula toruloides]
MLAARRRSYGFGLLCAAMGSALSLALVRRSVGRRLVSHPLSCARRKTKATNDKQRTDGKRRRKLYSMICGPRAIVPG